jgi:hypothetical protein
LECPGSGSDVCDLPERVRELHSSPGESIDALFQRFTVVVNNMRANVDVLPYDDHDRDVKLLHSLDHTVWGGKFEVIVKSKKYDTLTMNELFSKLKSAEVDRGMTAKIEGPTDSHSLALIGGSKGKANANPLLTVKIRQPSHEFTFGVGMTFVSYPLVLTPVV